MKRLVGLIASGTKGGRLALSALALGCLAAPALAGDVAVKYLGGVHILSSQALARATPAALPQPTQAQLRSAGILNADGTIARSAIKPSGTFKQAPQILSKGNPGTGALESVQLYSPKAVQTTTGTSGSSSGLASAGTVTPMSYGSLYEWPFTTSRVELTGRLSNSRIYPYRAAGRLFILRNNGDVAACSASLIKKGVIITAAHCVADFGVGYNIVDALFVPGFFNGKAPYGSVRPVAVYVLPSYTGGTEDCAVPGVVCTNDVALLVLSNRRGRFVGQKTGWLNVGGDGWGFNNSGAAQITQLGYPVGIDYGNQMIRNDSLGEVSDETDSFNTLIGSNMTPGSSGGPMLVNFGIPGVNNDAFGGFEADANFVVGVTSWGYFGGTDAVMGSSSFTSDNVGVMLPAACAAYPLACAP